MEIDARLVRPPYDSPMPRFPSEKAVRLFTPSADHNPNERQEKKDGEWGSEADRVFSAARPDARCDPAAIERGRMVVGTSRRTDGRRGRGGGRRAGSRIVRSRKDRGGTFSGRVFELGWTTELFGELDSRWNIDDVGGESESFGRKYQRIAHSEILGLVADHFEYREPGGEGRTAVHSIQRTLATRSTHGLTQRGLPRAPVVGT